MEIKAKLAKEKYAFNKDNETHLLVELSAPRVEINEERTPICLVPVLDVSGSMARDEKIDYVRKACRKLMDHLTPGDYAGVVAFDSNVYEIAPIQEVTQEHKENVKAAVAKLNAGSCTNLSGGLAKALEWINAMDLPRNTIMRVIVFTDGHANIGVTGRSLLEFSMELKQRATISTFGFGTDCDQELLADISSNCDGNYAFIDSADSAVSAFGHELGGLLTTYGQDVKITISPDKNNQILEILNDEDVNDNNGSITVGIRDILGEEKKWVVAKIRLSEVNKPLPREVNAFKVAVEFTNREGKKHNIEELPIKVKFCRPCDEPLQEDSEVVRHRDRLLAAKAQGQAEQYARVGNYTKAQQTLTLCCDSLSDESTKGVLQSLNASYSTASSYRSKKGVTNSVRYMLNQRRLGSRNREVNGYGSALGINEESEVLSNFVDGFTNNDSDNVNVTDTNVTDTNVDITTDTVESTTDTKSKKRSNYDW